MTALIGMGHRSTMATTALNATPKTRTVRAEDKKVPQEMKNDKFRVPRIAGPTAGESVGVRQGKAIDFPASGRVRPPFADRGSHCAEENPIMELTSPVNPLADVLGHLLPLVPLAKRWLEKQVGEAGVVPEPERMLTPKEASVLLNLHVQTVMAWCREGNWMRSRSVETRSTERAGGI